MLRENFNFNNPRKFSSAKLKRYTVCSQEEGAKTKKKRVPSVPKHAMTMNPEATPFTTAVDLWLRQDNLLQTASAVAFNLSNPQKREREFVLF